MRTKRYQKWLAFPNILHVFQEFDWHQKLCMFHEQLLVTDLQTSYYYENQIGELREVCFHQGN